MIDQQILDEFESPSFAASLGIASDLETFLEIARERPVVRQLVAHAAFRGIEDIVGRFTELTGRPHEAPHRRPWDTAAAVLLWIIAKEKPALAWQLASGVQGTHDRGWRWTSKLARQLNNQGSAVRVSYAGEYQFPLTSAQHSQTSQRFVVFGDWHGRENGDRRRAAV